MDEVSSIDTGKSKFTPQSEGAYEILGSTSIIGYTDSYDYEGDFLLTARVGANAGELYRHSGKVKISDNTVFIQGKQLDFIFYALLNFDIKRLAFGTGQPLVKASELKQQMIHMPTQDTERKKIGLYFSTLDRLITLQRQKCDQTKMLKKYMLQKMFPSDGQCVPEIRFSGFTDDWEQRKLGEICERITRKNKNNESDLPLTIASQYGLIDQRDFFNKIVAAKDMSNYYLLKKGEFAYNKSYSNGFDYGSIKRLNRYKQGCLSTLYICFGLTSDEVESDYLECYFDTLKWYRDITEICAEGARNHGLLNVDTKGFFEEVSVDMPASLEEQHKIARYLNTLDRLITLQQHLHDFIKRALIFTKMQLLATTTAMKKLAQEVKNLWQN
jgi:type I restriction enzyme S subunit